MSPFFAVEALDDGAWEDLAALAGPGGAALLVGPGRYDIPTGWRDVLTLEGAQMVAERLVAPPGDATIRPLTTGDVPAMLGLIELARPGPFSAGTVEPVSYTHLTLPTN